MSHADRVLQALDALDKRLVAKGFPATSPWWRETITRWYRSGKRQAVVRCGRRGGKSSTLSRLGVAEALYGEHNIPPGDIGVVAIISTRGPEALERLRTIQAILDALGVRYRPSRGNVEGVELLDRPIAFRVHVATIAGVSGFTGVFVLCDEVSKWRDADTGVNPASEVIRSVRPTLATQPNAKIVLSSSPMGTLDAHYDAFEEGETRLQVVAYAPSWVANPVTVTEDSTRADEPDEVVWEREYKAIPQAANTRSLLSAAVVDRAMARWVEHEPSELYKYVASIDPATRRNAFTFAATTMHADATRQVVKHDQWQGSPSKPLVIRATYLEIAKHIEPLGIKHVLTDQFAMDPMRELAQGTGVHLHVESWTQALYAEAFEGLKTIANEGKLILPRDPQVKQDLLDIVVKITRGGEAYDLVERGGRHADYAPVIAIALLRTKVRARVPEKQLSIQEQHLKQRNAWLMQRQKDRERREKFGRLPVTHRGIVK